MSRILWLTAWRVALVGAVTPFTTFAQEVPAPGLIIDADNRVPIEDARVARIMPVGCTGWLVSNGVFLSAGHCVIKPNTATTAGPDCSAANPNFDPNFKTIEFNVPPSSSSGTTKPPPEEDQYPIDQSTVQCQLINSGSYVKDWAVFAVEPNRQRESATERQKFFFRVVNISRFPNLKYISVSGATAANLRVTGYGTDGKPPNYGQGENPKNQYNQTEQTATGQFRGVFNSGDYWNLGYYIDTTQGNSGSPVILNGTGLTLGIHSGNPPGVDFNLATSFQLPALSSALHAFPGRFLTPTVPGDRIFYVDDASPYFTATPDGNLFSPFPTLTAAFDRIAGTGSPTMISVVTGGYPETINQTTGETDDIEVTLKADVILALPVGDVILWGKEDAAILSSP